MLITANIATYPPRMHSLKQCIASIYDQVDAISICFNEVHKRDWALIPELIRNLDREYGGNIQIIHPDKNLTDNGKFWYLDKLKPDTGLIEHEYYFMLDDDIIYPPDYVQQTIANIKLYGMIVTYHGRKLQGTGLDYYRDHKAFNFLHRQKTDTRVDVCGTGVTAFDTRYFHPNGLANHDLKKMSDLIFSLEASKQGKKIGCCAHEQGWLKTIIHEESIANSALKNGNDEQNKLADQIYKLNYE